jgi:hypothetical protein
VRQKLLRMLFLKDPARVDAIFGNVLRQPLFVWKAPLLKHGSGVTRRGDHLLNIAPATDIQGALAHFKFYPDLDAKIATALAEGQYVSGSMHYRLLQAQIELLNDAPLVTWETRRYEGPPSLEAALLLSGSKG